MFGTIDMEALIHFAQTVSPLGVIAILAIIIFNLVNGRLRQSRKPKDDPAISLTLLSQKLDTIAGNHLHDLPSMREDISEIKKSSNFIQKEQIKQGNRLTRVETILKVKE